MQKEKLRCWKAECLQNRRRGNGFCDAGAGCGKAQWEMRAGICLAAPAPPSHGEAGCPALTTLPPLPHPGPARQCPRRDGRHTLGALGHLEPRPGCRRGGGGPAPARRSLPRPLPNVGLPDPDERQELPTGKASLLRCKIHGDAAGAWTGLPLERLFAKTFVSALATGELSANLWGDEEAREEEGGSPPAPASERLRR